MWTHPRPRRRRATSPSAPAGRRANAPRAPRAEDCVTPREPTGGGEGGFKSDEVPPEPRRSHPDFLESLINFDDPGFDGRLSDHGRYRFHRRFRENVVSGETFLRRDSPSLRASASTDAPCLRNSTRKGTRWKEDVAGVVRVSVHLTFVLVVVSSRLRSRSRRRARATRRRGEARHSKPGHP